MARKLRIQYAGARYHVINRGNYRRDLFESVGAAQAFLEVLKEAASRHGWVLHAYVLMKTHYHLALETPHPNLVDGMHWMQSTWASRFNRFRNERGHLFQGRYQAILIEDATALGRVVNYIHLNPVRAKVVPAESVHTYRWSSLPKVMKGELDASPWLTAIGGWKNDASGRAAYLEYLKELGADEASWEREGLIGLSKGWAIGTNGWKQALAKEFKQMALSPGIDQQEVAELKEELWTSVLEEVLKDLGKTGEPVSTRPRKTDWKVEAAGLARERSGASIKWLAEKLDLGTPQSVRTYLYEMKRRRN